MKTFWHQEFRVDMWVVDLDLERNDAGPDLAKEETEIYAVDLQPANCPRKLHVSCLTRVLHPCSQV